MAAVWRWMSTLMASGDYDLMEPWFRMYRNALPLARARTAHEPVQTGRFGADMKVHLVNDGPVTLMLRQLP